MLSTSTHHGAAATLALSVLLSLVVCGSAKAADKLVGAVPAAGFTTDRHVATVKLRGASEVLSVRLRLRCGVGTTARLTVDRQMLIRRTIRSRRFKEVRVVFTAPAGRYRVALTSRGGSGPRCRRPLGNGAVRFLAASRTTGSAPVSDQGGAPGSNTVPDSTETPTVASGETTPPSTTTPSPAIPTRPRLAWAPPVLSAPTTVNVAQGDQTLSLDTTKDYVINVGNHAGGLVLYGGRNVKIVGGRIALPSSSHSAVGLGIRNATGVVHVEGVWFDGASGHEFDAVQIIAPRATVQLENIRAIGLRGSYNTNHTDVIQPWGGVAKLRVDRLTATTNYQGIFNQPDQGAIGPVDLRHVDMAYDNVGAKTGGYLLWLTNGCAAATTTLSEVYVKGRSGSTLGSTVWPPTGQATNCPGILSGTTAISWPSLPITGSARWGTPPGGSFVTAADVGVTYRSPGYG
ncbi:hypothetical protein [Baekduia sp. Peel2402]|uniref:hypothetical protein n=1 Tax=Baekduia sp. Peel2402 TaxID=3458296 RepID=UPI00403E7B20